ncbi:MAG: tRNA 2-thiouridine(34) synthase MnmA [bacterium]|nr:tRNA 2-thiouridine(34) synthase MnmA [bacterium]
MDKTDIPGTFNAVATLGPVNETNMARIWNKHKQSNTPLKRKVFVGLSGGVDSAVSAALLQQAGAEVTGVFIKGWYPPEMSCTWAEERRDAMRVAARLGIRFRTLDASAEYKKNVIDYLIGEYRAGRTPNPDVMCNKEVKFGAFYRFAKAHGADAIAMGHYRSGEKDQSYFLWAVPKDILNATIFPIGNMEKGEVRALARKFNIPVAEKKDSQGVCFLGSVSIKEFLKKELGDNNPALLYTIGQRVPLSNGPWYVIGKDIEKKKIVVSKSRSSSAHEVFFTNANWFEDISLVQEAQYRYRCRRITGHIKESRFISEDPLPETPAPGQSIVFYRGNKLIGGGIIV